MINDVKKVVTNLEGMIPVYGTFCFHNIEAGTEINNVFTQMVDVLRSHGFTCARYGFEGAETTEGDVLFCVSSAASCDDSAVESCSLLSDAELMTILDKFDTTKVVPAFEQICERMKDIGYDFDKTESFMYPVYCTRLQERNVDWRDIYQIYGNYILVMIQQMLAVRFPVVIKYYPKDLEFGFALEMDFPTHYDMGIIEVTHSVNFPEEHKELIEIVVTGICEMINLEPAPVIYSPMEAQ